MREFSYYYTLNKILNGINDNSEDFILDALYNEDFFY
jgi:hypothetical protein